MEIFNPRRHGAQAAGALLTDRGGPLLTHVELYAVMFDDFSLSTEMSGFLSWLATSDVLSELAEYNTGLGVYSGAAHISLGGSPPPPPPPPPPPGPPPPPVPGSLEQCIIDCFQANGYAVRKHIHKKRGIGRPAGTVITDAQLQTRLAQAIQNREVITPSPDGSTLYVLYPPSGVAVDLGQDASCQTFCGYHDSFSIGGKPIYYAVLPFPDCSGCTAGMSALDALTVVTSHEVCEAITDPVPGTGWYDDKNGEIGDICAWKVRRDGGYMVQLEWSNAHNSCI